MVLLTINFYDYAYLIKKTFNRNLHHGYFPI